MRSTMDNNKKSQDAGRRTHGPIESKAFWIPCIFHLMPSTFRTEAYAKKQLTNKHMKTASMASMAQPTSEFMVLAEYVVRRSLRMTAQRAHSERWQRRFFQLIMPFITCNLDLIWASYRDHGFARRCPSDGWLHQYRKHFSPWQFRLVQSIFIF